MVRGGRILGSPSRVEQICGLRREGIDRNHGFARLGPGRRSAALASPPMSSERRTARLWGAPAAKRI